MANIGDPFTATLCFECEAPLAGPYCPKCNPVPLQEWQAIETAPKDGDCILACAVGPDPMDARVVFWYEWDQAHPDTGDAERQVGWAVPDGNVYAPALFTHWMPVPLPPTSNG